MKTRSMTRTQAELLLAAVIIARSTSYVLTKVGLQDMGKFTLLAVRFLLAFAFLAALFRRRLLQIDRRTLLSGLAMGGIYFCVMTAEHAALFCALNPFVAAALGAVCFHEHFGLAGLLGGALILAGIVVSCRPQKTSG